MNPTYLGLPSPVQCETGQDLTQFMPLINLASLGEESPVSPCEEAVPNMSLSRPPFLGSIKTVGQSEN
jgi:hypothetical protein